MRSIFEANMHWEPGAGISERVGRSTEAAADFAGQVVTSDSDDVFAEIPRPPGIREVEETIPDEHVEHRTNLPG